MSSNGESSSSAAAGGQNLPALHTSAETFLKNDYDFIIIGGGTAGLVVAARLTENEDIKVGVLEAGKSRLGDFLVDSPAMFMQMFMNPEYDWCHMTEPQVSIWMSYTVAAFGRLIIYPETQQGPSPPHPPRKGSWWFIRH